NVNGLIKVQFLCLAYATVLVQDVGGRGPGSRQIVEEAIEDLILIEGPDPVPGGLHGCGGSRIKEVSRGPLVPGLDRVVLPGGGGDHIFFHGTGITPVIPAIVSPTVIAGT